MKELSPDLLPLMLETEMSKDWSLLNWKYQQFTPNALVQCLNAREFPSTRRTKFVSSRTGLLWNMICVCEERNRYTSGYLFYTPYTTPKGKQGCLSISEDGCEHYTVHFLDRICTRFFHPRGIYPKGLDETMELFVRHLAGIGGILFISRTNKERYIVLKHGIAIVDVEGNGLVRYITFVTFEMLRHYQTPYKRAAERLYELYMEHNRNWHPKKFSDIINAEGLMPDSDPLRQIDVKPHRKLDPPNYTTSRISAWLDKKNQQIIKEQYEEAAKSWTPDTSRPGSNAWINASDIEKSIADLLEQRKKK